MGRRDPQHTFVDQGDRTSRASQSRVALSATASSTGWISVGEPLMTRRIAAGRRLLLQRLGQLAVPRFELLEQPDVLDRRSRPGRPASASALPEPRKRAPASRADSEGADTAAPRAAAAQTARLACRSSRRSREGSWDPPAVRPRAPQRPLGSTRVASPESVSRRGNADLTASRSPAGPRIAATETCWPSDRLTEPMVAPHRRSVFSKIASNTGLGSVGEVAMTRRISAGRRLAARAPRSARGSAPRAPGTAARSRSRSPPGRRRSGGAGSGAP